MFWDVKCYNFWHVWYECSKSHTVMGPCSCFAHDNTIWSNNYITPIIKKKKLYDSNYQNFLFYWNWNFFTDSTIDKSKS